MGNNYYRLRKYSSAMEWSMEIPTYNFPKWKSADMLLGKLMQRFFLQLMV